MSEFSDCYYLFDENIRDAISLIKKTRRYGIVLPKVNRYVPFLVDGAWDAGKLIDDVIANNPGVVMHYNYAEDHGIWIKIYRQSYELLSAQVYRHGSSCNRNPVSISNEMSQLGIISELQTRELQDLFYSYSQMSPVDISHIRDEIDKILEIKLLHWFGSAHLSHLSFKQISQHFPKCVFVLKNRRGQADKAKNIPPNEWCPKEGLPAFMYLPVPDDSITHVDEVLLERHIKHWIDTGDWDDERQVGFWLYTGYMQALPPRMKFLANRIMNLQLAFGLEGYELELRRTVRGILAVTDPCFDWEPYFTGKAGEQSL